MANQVPENLINFKVWLDGSTELLGVADVTLPSLEPMTDTVKGAGIAGEFESPTPGHYKSMTASIKWRVVTANFLKLAQVKVWALEARGAIKVLDAGAGEYKTSPLRVVLRGVPKKFELGKLDVGAQMDSGSEFELSYLKIDLDGATLFELDKFNNINVVNGTDVLSEVRAALGDS